MSDTVVYFEHGEVYKMRPEPKDGNYYEHRELINNATIIFSEGIRYDLTDINSILSIAKPDYLLINDAPHAVNLGVTGSLEYVLHMHANLLWRKGDYNLAIACQSKATELMPVSPSAYTRDHYRPIIHMCIERNYFWEAWQWEQWIKKNTLDLAGATRERFRDALSSCKFLDTDLLEVYCSNICCCPKCAKYRNRVYSLSGHSLFPKLPSNLPLDCVDLSFSPYVKGVTEPFFKCKSVLLHSWRPFRDDRTRKEKENYLSVKAAREKREAQAQKSNLNHMVYFWLRWRWPDLVPKSLSAFSTIRNANSPKYQRIIDAVNASGLHIPTSLADAAAMDNRQ